MNYYSKIKIYFPIAVWPALVLALHLTCQELGFYYTIKWLDTLMHFLGGISIAIGTYYIFEHLEKQGELKASKIVKIFLAMSVTALAAVLWEIVEFADDSLFGSMHQPSVWDTMKDLTMGLLGASAVGIYNKFRK